MRNILITLSLLFAALSVKAQSSVSGICIDGGGSPILVYFGKTQMCMPTTTCFVANLKPGYYNIEVYESREPRPRERPWQGERLYSQRVYYKGTGVQNIYVDAPVNNHPSRPVSRPNQNGGYPEYEEANNVMSARLFDTLYKSVASQTSDADRIKVIDTAVGTSDFTCNQCQRLMGLFRFDGDKTIVMRKMYPRIVDKQGFFALIGMLTYSENKDKMNAFVKEYNATH